jgi:hypothetical protein
MAYKYIKIEPSGSSDKRRKYKLRVGNKSSGTEYTKSYHRTKKGAESCGKIFLKK